MLISRTSILSGKNSEMELDITNEQLELWHKGMLIQSAMPNLSPDEREFLISGITPEEWKAYCSEEEE